jgi:hypothetical protein
MREPTGEIRYSTFYSSGAGRSWQGGFPEEVKGFETIEIDASEMSNASVLRDAISSAARSLSTTTGKRVEAKIGKLRGPPRRIRLTDLSILHTGLQPAFRSSNQTEIGEALIEFLEEVLCFYQEPRTELSNRIIRYEQDLLKRYREKLEPGLKAACLLLLIQISRASQPNWPFGSVPWVCGALDCDHAYCRVSRNEFSRPTDPLRALLGGALYPQTLYSQTLKNTITVGGLLHCVVSNREGLKWLEDAASSLLKLAERLRDSLSSSKSADQFYSIHHEIMVFCGAALLGYGYLSMSGSDERRAEFKQLENASEEIKARTIDALLVDMSNTVHLDHLLAYRIKLAGERQKSEREARLLMQKWIHDETTLPSLWEPFLWGSVDELNLTSEFSGEGLVERVYDFILRAIERPRRFSLA